MPLSTFWLEPANNDVNMAMLIILAMVVGGDRDSPVLIMARYRHARLKPKGIEAKRLNQLDTLLLSARLSCNGLSAEFVVIGAA